MYIEQICLQRLPVALLAEGVDRNSLGYGSQSPLEASPSSRRAWIEIRPCPVCVADTGGSPSSRRAWIEMAK